jgi:hypothetical protein
VNILGPCRQYLAASALALLSASGMVAQTPPQESCKSDDSAKIIRIDDRNERIFVIAQVNQINSTAKARKLLLSLQVSLKQCRPGWGRTWSVSFFSDPKYAGYKSDDNMAAFVASGNWSKAYLGEYERQTQRLIMNPAEREKIRFLKVPLP